MKKIVCMLCCVFLLFTSAFAQKFYGPNKWGQIVDSSNGRIAILTPFDYNNSSRFKYMIAEQKPASDTLSVIIVAIQRKKPDSLVLLRGYEIVEYECYDCDAITTLQQQEAESYIQAEAIKDTSIHWIGWKPTITKIYRTVWEKGVPASQPPLSNTIQFLDADKKQIDKKRYTVISSVISNN